MPVGLHALEDLLRVVQDRSGRVERQRPVRRDARVVPALGGRPLDREHVVGEVDPEAGVGQDLGQPGVVDRMLGAGGADLHGHQSTSCRFVCALTCGRLAGRRRRIAATAGGDRVADLGGTADRPGYSFRHVSDGRALHGGRGVGVPEVVEQQRRGQDRCRRVGLLLAGDVGSRAVHGLEHARGGAVRVDVARGSEADAAGDGGGEVGDDVAEQVVRDDHVEPRRVGGQEDHRRVHVDVVDRDVRELRRHGLDEPPPERSGVDQHVGLVDQGELLAGPALGPRERVAHDPLHAVRRVDRDLGGDLGGGTDPERTAVARVGTLGALADHHEVDLSGVREGRGDAGEDPGRTQVHVVVELEPQPQQQPALEDARGEVRVVRLPTDRTEQDGVVLPDLGEHGVRQHLTGREVALRAQVVAGLLELDLGRRRDLEHLQRLGGHLGTDAVAGDDREPEGCHGRRR